MSAYAHQMEREFSAQDLSSRGGSEMGSRYLVESGFYMTSYAAAIFIGGLVIVGVLMVTLLIAVTVMLQTCESRSKGVVAIQTPNYDYDHCKIFAMHAELNNLRPKDFPSMCKNFAVQNIREGRYARDLNSSLLLVEKYFDNATLLNDGLDVVIMDIDDILPTPDYAHQLIDGLNQYGCSGCFEEAEHLKQKLLLRLYNKLQARGWSLILLSSKPERLRNATVEQLIFAGYRGWSSVIMRSDDELEMNIHEYFTKRRTAILTEGFRVTGVISSRMDALIGQSPGQRRFKLPNPIFYYLHPFKENLYEK
ncbi:uncharacterized protein At2g39920 [Mercurialis annua]|uniref:uncharacterized protein At2g39920 n=1 Tax=Mercurialis annua TaxID=3986 RepID=UPI00215E0EA2|nr:uncharacterized protein At2g39920 [Mercurialis annua]XP_050210992.1 uncharacterized protein At2g39920 [Mercurialis annua]XP_050210993.1 uncharacterized protein At2g39920 [Mercurialis annua]XP_050210994.1 uncharacterized protein At2g39920 [Mercurialis annua]